MLTVVDIIFVETQSSASTSIVFCDSNYLRYRIVISTNVYNISAFVFVSQKT